MTSINTHGISHNTKLVRAAEVEGATEVLLFIQRKEITDTRTKLYQVLCTWCEYVKSDRFSVVSRHELSRRLVICWTNKIVSRFLEVTTTNYPL